MGNNLFGLEILKNKFDILINGFIVLNVTTFCGMLLTY